MSVITVTMQTFRDRTADITYCADVTLFLHATSDGLSLIAALFLRRFLAFYCFKFYLGSYSKCKNGFSSNITHCKDAEQDQIDAKWLEKSFSDARVEEQVEA